MERSLVLSAGLSPAALGLLGLVAGAALNRLVERLPARTERDCWREVAAQLADADAWPRVLGIAPAAAGVGLARDISAARARVASRQMKRPCKSLTYKAFGCWWRFRDSNPGPADYDSVALTG